MTAEVEDRLNKIQMGMIPFGYKMTRKGIIPVTWAVQPIKNFATVSSGSTPDRKNEDYWNGDIPWVTTGELQSGYIVKTKENVTEQACSKKGLRKYPVGTLLMAMYGQGKTRGTVARLGIEATVNQACAAISIKEGNSEFYFYSLQNAYDDIRKMSNTGNQENLNADIIKSFPLICPTDAEQEKIAQILLLQDTLIELKEAYLQEKLKQKEYLVQQLLTGRKRLAGFDSEWKKVRLNEVLTERKERNANQDLRICSVAVEKGVVDQIEHLGRSYAASDTSNYGVAHFGDVIYTKSPTGNFPYGIIKQNHMEERVAVSPLYGIYEPITYALGFILHTYFMYAVNAQNYLFPIVQKGAKNTINITNETFISNYLYLPLNAKEQEALMNVFKTIDYALELLQKELEQEKQKKKALMQLLLTGIVRVR